MPIPANGLILAYVPFFFGNYFVKIESGVEMILSDTGPRPLRPGVR
jgi:hypothetical protein